MSIIYTLFLLLSLRPETKSNAIMQYLTSTDSGSPTSLLTTLRLTHSEITAHYRRDYGSLPTSRSLVFYPYFKFTLPYSHHPLQTPTDKGLKPREGKSFTLPSPSHFYPQRLPSVNMARNGREKGEKREGDGREKQKGSRASNALPIGV